MSVGLRHSALQAISVWVRVTFHKKNQTRMNIEQSIFSYFFANATITSSNNLLLFALNTVLLNNFLYNN